ncbi:MAG: pyruvate kinase [Myxococcota bacterium]|nr:pyruvate kinase [Myxococcota bacterium]
MTSRKAKIVCTVGPATDTPESIRELIEAGMDVARLNFSHGSHEEHARRAEWIRSASADLDKPVAILQDLCGPKIRTGRRGPASVEAGQTLRVVPGDIGTADTLAIGYERLASDLEKGDRILLGDGEIELRVVDHEDDALVCHVEHGGDVRARQGANLPAGRIQVESITDQDRKDLAFGLDLGVDYVALSFVRSAADVEQLRALCADAPHPPSLVPKIETPSAVAAIEDIAEISDALMLARGDLGVELSPEAVPVVQKQVLEVCRQLHTPAIVATEMLQSMVTAVRPTRAEASDVANAVFDGADAVMLSAETASGEHPARACATMARIIAEAEASPFFVPRPAEAGSGTNEAIARAACDVARRIQARAIVVLSASGGTARLVSQARPDRPVYGIALEKEALRKMALFWGIQPERHDLGNDVEELSARVRNAMLEDGDVQPGDRVVVIFGTPLGEPGSTNSIRVEAVP